MDKGKPQPGAQPAFVFTEAISVQSLISKAVAGFRNQ